MQPENKASILADLASLKQEFNDAGDKVIREKGFSLGNLFGRYTNEAFGDKNDAVDVQSAIDDINDGRTEQAKTTLKSISAFRHLSANGWKELGASKWRFILGDQKRDIDSDTNFYTKLDKIIAKM